MGILRILKSYTNEKNFGYSENASKVSLVYFLPMHLIKMFNIYIDTY